MYEVGLVVQPNQFHEIHCPFEAESDTSVCIVLTKRITSAIGTDVAFERRLSCKNLSVGRVVAAKRR